MPDVSVFTGLAAVRLSSSDGTRLFFHDSDAALHQLEYKSDGWDYIGQVNPDGHLQGPSLGAAVVRGTNMYTVEPRSDNNIEIANTNNGKTWDIETTPQPLSNSDTTSTSTQNFTTDSSVTVLAGLQAWSSGISSIGLAIDQDESKYIYYIGSDKALHYVTSQDGLNLGSWSVEDSIDTKYWPVADDTDGEFAVASDPSSYDIRIYYMSGGTMTEVSRTGKDTWAEAKALPTKATATVSRTFSTTSTSALSTTVTPATSVSKPSGSRAEIEASAKSTFKTPSSSPGSTQTTKPTNTQGSGSSPAETSGTSRTSSSSSSNTSASSSKGDSSGGGLSPAATYGIGIAAGLSVLIIAATWTGCYFARRRNKRKQGEQDEIALAPQQAGIDTISGNKPHDHGNFAGDQLGASLLDGNGIPKDMVASVALSPPQDHAPRTTMSPRFHRLAHPPVYELPVYSRADRSAKHELPGSDTEDMSISN
ncbi:hypothetical protein VMCG_07067 [Cytospora schulzeri]|uniref:Fucose-specific lectin n=1 Tax=Cytospora schulzeri TaxID=448051 RepID=A0A423W3T4_9PEZI|nr:hypothetical protein VMCG_07067 [Valsa malicola]